jgi:putrescine transport system permease protein
MKSGASWFNTTSVALGLAFLYLPILILVIYSFNDSRLVTVWGGWSTRWYGVLFHDNDFLNAAWVTLRIGAASATLATILGTLSAVVLVRLGRFRTRMAFSAMVYAPLVMPEIIIGISLALFFGALSVQLGFWTVTLAHTTLTMCFVTVVVQSRLLSFDRSIEEAALDLGCRPFKGFFLITLPIIAPAVISGWMLAFTLSLDDLVIARFTSSAGINTLPMIIYSQVKLGVKPEMNAACTLMLAVVALGVVVAAIYTRRAEAERERAERLAAAG